jgi:hypothetical protein
LFFITSNQKNSPYFLSKLQPGGGWYMLKNHFSRKCLGLLFALAIVSLAAGDVQGAKEEKDKDTKEKTYAINEAQLQSHLMSFADRFASILDMAIAKFESFNPTGKGRYEVLELMTFSLHQAFLLLCWTCSVW